MTFRLTNFLFVDDVRNPPIYFPVDGTYIARSYDEAIALLTQHNFHEVSLDHDIASYDENGKEKTGYDIALWMAERKQNGKYVPPVVRCHSANPVGRANIESVIKRYLT